MDGRSIAGKNTVWQYPSSDTTTLRFLLLVAFEVRRMHQPTWYNIASLSKFVVQASTNLTGMEHELLEIANP